VPEHLTESISDVHFQPFGRSSDAERMMLIHRSGPRLAEQGRIVHPDARIVPLSFNRRSPEPATSGKGKSPPSISLIVPPELLTVEPPIAGSEHTLAPTRLTYAISDG